MPGTGQRGGEELALAASATPADAAAPAGGPPFTDEPLTQAPTEPESPQTEPGRLTARARRVLSGRGWTTTAVTADAVMLVLAVVAALIGANAAHVHASEPWLVWTFPPIVVALLAIRGRHRPKITVEYLHQV